MRKIIEKKKNRRRVKRLVSFLIVFAMVFNMFPPFEFGGKNQDGKNPFVLSVQAAEEDDETDERFMADKDANGYRNITIYPGIFVDYSEHCQMYPYYHQFDNLTITTTGNENQNIFQYGFKGIGTDNYPFGGSISIGANQNITLNIDAPLFNAVYDSVTMTDSNNGGILRISREFDLDQTQIKASNEGLPLIAKRIAHNADSSSATWNISVVKPSAGDNPYLANFGGFIGSMDDEASIAINLDMNATEADSGLITMTGVADSDIGLLCGHMGSDSELTFSLTASRGINSISTAYGNVGGLVGSMDPGAALYYTGTNIQSANTDIKTTAGDSYAGGLVGYNNGGTVSITLPSGVTAYPVAQYMEGTAGAGGLYGYYKPGAVDTENDTINTLNSGINTGNYSIACQVNGTGYDGGLFGVFENENNYAITGTATITSTHNSGSAVGYGGLIGRYNNDDLTEKLEIGAVTATSTKNSSATYYGGAIAFIGDSITDGSTDGGSVYVKFDGLTVSATGADAMTFGGLSAKADNAFIDANNVTIGVTGEHKFQGGAVVGSLESGVLRMTGYTDVSGTLANAASYKAGQIVGYRNNALVFGGDGWKLRRNTSDVEVDDIGSWGEIVRFGVKDTSTEDETKYGFGSDATVITVDESAHMVTIAGLTLDEDDGSTILVGTSSDFAKAALNMQLESQSDVLQFENSSDYLSTNIKLDADLVLSGLGISSFTRDNAETDSDTADKCVYSGTFDGNGHSVTLAIGEPYGYHINSSGETPVEIAITDHTTEGSGKIYRHRYNGLFGITSTSSGDDYGNNAKNVTFDGYITVKANDTVYVGSVAGLATNDFRVDSVNMIDTITSGVHSTEFKIEGSKSAYVGGFVGKTTNSVENLSIKNCNVVVNINSGNSEDGSCCGGIIGWSNRTGQSADWDFINDTVSGSISRSGKHEVNKLGGLVAAITEYSGTSEREIELTNVNISDLSISATGSADKDSSVGGLLGYSWLNVNPTFHNVQVSDESSVTLSDTASEKGDLAGLVYQGTGHWIIETSSADVEVPDIDEETGEQKKDEETGEPLTTTVTEYYDGIKINSIAVSSTNAKSFGMIINKGMADNSAIFLDVREDDTSNSKKSYLISSATLTGLYSSCIFDELVAYSANDGKVLENGQGVVSIHTGLTTDGTSSSKTYEAQTSRGAVPNNKTRYYYDLDTIIESSNDADKLMRWALDLYAHKSIRTYFNSPGWTNRDSSTGDVTTVNIPVGNYDMVNYSWYPVNMAGVITVNGTFKFYNDEFEDSEDVKKNSETYAYKRTSLYDADNGSPTQHHLMHCGLLRNVSGGVTVGTSGITLQGNVGRYGTKGNSSVSYTSGALICGTIKGGSTSSIATFTTNGNIYLDGIYVHDHNSNSYAPLLINKIGEFSTVVVKNVRAKTSSSYTTDFKAASSLIGDVGSSGATNINITFADIQIDGRKNSGTYSLDSVYNTKSSIFYRASLLNTFRYASGSGVYDFNIGDDWTESSGSYTTPHTNGVTYGSEIDDANSQHLGREFWYKDTNGTSNIYTNYNTPGASGTGAPSPAISFSGFLPYVYSKCSAAEIDTAEDKKYQLKVNWSDTSMTGCGTYNDPYIITSGDDFVKIANILNGNKSLTISLPKIADNDNVDATKLKQKKWDDYGHTDFTGNGTNYVSTANSSKSYTPEVVQNYLAGAYYKIKPNATITLPSTFAGFCNQNNEQATFRGVIVGNGETITLTGENPLIYQSNGCVVKGLNIVVSKSEIAIDQGSNSTFTYSSGKAYGAVIGKIMGGDNIIDDVTVSFGNSKIKLKGNYAQTVPVGGYVGVVVKGSLIFRGMEKYRENESLWNSISGLGATTVKDNSGNTNLLYIDAENKTPNMKWLYVNPIVGRVLNGAVFTEGSAYRPFEDGTREGVYIKTSSDDSDPENAEDYTSIAVDTDYEKYSQPVTMQNGLKNYSIADITDNLAMFTTNTPQRNSTFKGNADFRRYLTVDIGIPNAQSLFIMSLVTQSGLGATNYLQRYDRDNAKASENNNYYPNNYAKPVGGFLNTGNWGIAPYYKYRATHAAEYIYVGNCDGGGIPEPTSDKAWYDDYTKAKTDNAQFNRTGTENNHSRAHGVEAIPYIIGKYTPKIPNDTSGMTLLISTNDDQKISNFQTNYLSNINGKELGYIAFCLTHQYTYLNLTFSGTEDVFYMPDGYRGLGTLGYNNFLSGGVTEVYQDLIVHLYGINGNNKTINLNMNLYAYHYIYGTNYDAYLTSYSSPGFGFMDAMMQNKDAADDNIDASQEKYQIRNFTLTGTVNYELIKAADGTVYPYNNTLTASDKQYFWATGGLAGNVVYNSGASATVSGVDIFKISINEINLSNLKVNGTKNTGGLIGYNESHNDPNSKTTIKNITTSNLEVSSGIYTGGLIGYTTQTAVEISNVTIDEPNIKSDLAFATTSGLSTNATGGIIGYAATSANNGSVYLHDITIGTESPDSGYSAYIGYNEPSSYPTARTNETIRVGGLIGQVATNSSTMIGSTGDDHIDYNTLIEKCNVYNVDIYGHKSGGIVGSSEGANAYLGIFDSVVKSNSSAPKTIQGQILTNNDNENYGGTGGVIGYTSNLNNRLTIQNCTVNSYLLSGYKNAGGIIGYLSGSDTYKALICDSSVENLRLSSVKRVGGLIGTQNKSLDGYNILTRNIQFTSPGGSITNYGNIIGYNNSKVIKIAGFSRQDLSDSNLVNMNYHKQEQMVGNKADTAADRYGTGGYVIFADYYNTYSNLLKGTKASTVNDDNNVTVNTYRIDTKVEEDNNFPYVTVNPQRAIENIGDRKFLTGDAIAALSYDSSVFKRIISDRNQNKAGAYTNFNALTEAQINAISSQFSTSSLQVSGSGAPNIPLLVIEDTSYQTITPIINNYINVLANTKGYNYAADDSIHKISLNKCVYDKDDGYTIYADGTACLKRSSINNSWYFRMTANNVDNATEGVLQFSLLDVQFLNPSNTEEVAYHLYIPVYVKKLLQYDFKAAIISNTEYYTSAYGTLNGNSLFENLGNPVTLKFEYKYTRTPSEWVDAINGGENLLSNLYKTIDIDAEAWPTGTRLVLVDANNNDKNYYLDNPSVGNGVLNLRDFTDENGENYNPAPLNSLMTVTVGQPPSGTRNLCKVIVDTNGTYQEQLAEAIAAGATVYSSGNFYRPIDIDNHPEDADLTTDEKYAVNGVSTIQPERYYLSIFTPKSSDTNIYHYQFTGSDSFNRIDTEEGEEYLNDGYRPNHITKTNAVVHFYIGDLYENTFDMTVSSRTTEQEMNMSTNNYLTVTMTSTIQLKSVPSEVAEGVTGADYDKTRKGVAQNMWSNRDTAEIYQAFLSTYDKKDTTAGSSNVSINMQAPPFVGVNSYNYYLGTSDSGTVYPISYPDPNTDGISENYVTLANNVNIISEISKASNDYAITFKVVYELRYFNDDELAAQFSPNPERKDGIGTKVIGFSNIASSQDGVEYSAASKKDDTTSLRYYVADSSKATLTYNVSKTTDEMLGPYSYLGINPQETNEKEHLIKTVAQYNTESLKDNGDYIEFSIKLHYKNDDYATNLPIGTYFKDLKIYGTNDDVIFDSAWANGYTKSLNGVAYLKATNTGSEYKVRVHKDYVQKQGGNDSKKYLLPIDYTVYTGDEKFNAGEGGLKYSNYKVSVHAEMWTAVIGGTESDPSNADNYLIYTNARVEPDVIP